MWVLLARQSSACGSAPQEEACEGHMWLSLFWRSSAFPLNLRKAFCFCRSLFSVKYEVWKNGLNLCFKHPVNRRECYLKVYLCAVKSYGSCDHHLHYEVFPTSIFKTSAVFVWLFRRSGWLYSNKQMIVRRHLISCSNVITPAGSPVPSVR